MYKVTCPVCTADTMWAMDEGLPWFMSHYNCTCRWNEHDWSVVMELAKDLAPLSEKLLDECPVCRYPAPAHDEKLHQEREKRLEEMSLRKRRFDAAAHGKAVFAYRTKTGERYYRTKALVPESVLKKGSKRKWHREAITVGAKVVLGCWSPLVIVDGEDDGK